MVPTLEYIPPEQRHGIYIRVDFQQFLYVGDSADVWEAFSRALPVLIKRGHLGIWTDYRLLWYDHGTVTKELPRT